MHGQNTDHKICECDLSDVDRAVGHISPLNPDLIIGGPPCQDFSSAGKRVEKGNASLTIVFSKIVSRVRPSHFVMENVVRTKNSVSYAKARRIFKQAGYGLTEIVLDASYCGVPQTRKRFFCIGRIDHPDDLFCEVLVDAQAKKQLNVAEYMGEEIDTELYYRHPRNYSRRAIYSINEPSPTIRGVNRPVAPNYPGHPLDAGSIAEARPLTAYERSRIQTFPKDWEWIGTKSQIEQMIGNAVPVNLAHFVGYSILEVH